MFRAMFVVFSMGACAAEPTLAPEMPASEVARQADDGEWVVRVHDGVTASWQRIDLSLSDGTRPDEASIVTAREGSVLVLRGPNAHGCESGAILPLDVVDGALALMRRPMSTTTTCRSVTCGDDFEDEECAVNTIIEPDGDTKQSCECMDVSNPYGPVVGAGVCLDTADYIEAIKTRI